jgi:hypothetical protein
MSRLETGFQDVDAAGDAESYADYLSHVNGLESVADLLAAAQDDSRAGRTVAALHALCCPRKRPIKPQVICQRA